MNSQQREQIAKDLVEDCMNVMSSKGIEYSGKEDVLANFKNCAKALGLTPLQVLIVFMQKHYDSIISAVKANPDCPIDGSEPFDSRLIDLVNYVIMLKCLRDEYLELSPYRVINASVVFTKPDEGAYNEYSNTK